MKESEMTMKMIGKVFGLFPDSAILIGDNETVETPDDKGVFSEVLQLVEYEAHGDSIQTSQRSEHTHIPKNVPGNQGGKNWPSFSRSKISRPPGVTASEIKEESWQKIHNYTENDLKKHTIYPLHITTSTANCL